MGAKAVGLFTFAFPALLSSVVINRSQASGRQLAAGDFPVTEQLRVEERYGPRDRGT